MSIFVRRGHWREGPQRVRHWVSDHVVSRDWWTAAEWELKKSPKLAAWVNPNAQCPVCGKPVYFYGNAAGSRVYFDELGKPWPKHRCTDVELHDPYQLNSQLPVFRSPAETRAYKEAARKARIEVPNKPSSTVLTLVSVSDIQIVAIPMGLGEQYTEHYQVISASAGGRPLAGDLLFRTGPEISFFHRPTFAVVTLVVRRM